MTTHTFYFSSTESPTQFNLQKHLLTHGFKTSKAKNADFSDKNLTLNENHTQLLEYKHLLATLTEKHCPDVMPLTYRIDDNNYSEVIQMISEKFGDNKTWILKPALLNNGQGIKVFQHLNDIKTHYQGTDRYGGLHVLQQYLLHPHLLNGHKYTFRMFVIITNFAGVYLYKNGYFNVGREAYNANDFSNLGVHLTNEHLNPDHSPNIWQIPTTRCPNFDVIYQQMNAIVKNVIHALKNEAADLLTDHSEAKAFSLFGFDFILDEQLKLWLLEVNHAPCFPKDEQHILQQHLYDEFWETIVRDFIEPIVERNDQRVGKSTLVDAV